MGFVPQTQNVFPSLSVLENLQMGAFIREDDISETMAQVFKLFPILAEKAEQPAGELSGGQQQRVGIARSLAVEPDIWFLDEPFSALDPLIRREMQDEFLRLQSVLNKTIMFVTHDFDEALRLADRIAIMKDGIIEQLDTPGKIVLNPATEYVKKFTQDVPREKVLKVNSIMDAPVQNASSSTVSSEALLESVAEQILNTQEILSVKDPKTSQIVGSINQSKVIKILFGAQ